VSSAPTPTRGVRIAVGFASLALLSAPALVPTPATASGVAHNAVSTTAGAVCITGSGKPTRYRGVEDTAPVSKAVEKQVAGQLAAQTSRAQAGAARTSSAARAAVTLPPRIYIPVRIHVIHGKHKRDRNVSRQAARRLFYTLRAGFNARQDPTMTPTGIIFTISTITVSRNDRWYHATPGSRAEKQMKRKLHRGNARVLNVYLNNVQTPDGALLGYARFPWLRASHPMLDGITINVQSLPGGKARGYNLGDTIIHETGHWLGLFHTFQNGCDAPGDEIADTPAEGQPSFQCQKTRDTCPTALPAGWVQGDPLPAPEADPVTNFMDYSYDTCMNHFTPDQRTRMVTAFMRYRYGR
jgi:hypothetical protein